MTAPVCLISLTLRNFKAIGDEPQTISFAPITLLFGPNSAGKSTIIHALHYAREILCNENLDPHQIHGDALDLGGFRSLVHNHDLDRTVQLGFEFHILRGAYARPSWLSGRTADEFEKIFNQMLVFSLEIDVRFSELRRRVYVARFSTAVNCEPVGTIDASADGRRVDLDNLNIHHPVLFDPEAECWHECDKEEIEEGIGGWFGWLEPPSEPTSEHAMRDDPQPAARMGAY